MTRVLICGDRNWTDAKSVATVLDQWNKNTPISTVIHGAANGADTAGEQAAKLLRIPIESYPADWKQYGKKAGPIRNKQMLDSKIDYVLAFHDNIDDSKGTKHMINIALKANVPIYLFSHTRNGALAQSKLIG